MPDNPQVAEIVKGLSEAQRFAMQPRYAPEHIHARKQVLAVLIRLGLVKAWISGVGKITPLGLSVRAYLEGEK